MTATGFQFADAIYRCLPFAGRMDVVVDQSTDFILHDVDQTGV
jgi:hypothetical protein